MGKNIKLIDITVSEEELKMIISALERATKEDDKKINDILKDDSTSKVVRMNTIADMMNNDNKKDLLRSLKSRL